MLSTSQQTVHSHFSVRVALVPVGDISPATFANYANTFKLFTTIPKADLTPPGDFSRDASAFKCVVCAYRGCVPVWACVHCNSAG